jgi:AraC-like DNA-binding protein
MELDILKGHKFQMISFCYVYHPVRSNDGKIQINSDSHLLHITKGRGSINFDGRAYRIKTGDTVSIPPLSPFTMNISDDFEMMNIHYNLWLSDGSSLDSVKRLPAVFSPPYFKWCAAMLSRIKRETERASPKKAPDILAHEIALRHLTENSLTDAPGNVRDPRTRKIQNFLENPRLNQFDSGALASLVSLSKSQMNRSFKNITGVSPRRHWETQRLKNICLALKGSNAAVYEIAENWGFEDSGYFCRWFKKMTGHSPAVYRKKLSEDGAL